MEKIDYEAPELIVLDSPLAVSGDSKCALPPTEEQGGCSTATADD